MIAQCCVDSGPLTMGLPSADGMSAPLSAWSHNPTPTVDPLTLALTLTLTVIGSSTARAVRALTRVRVSARVVIGLGIVRGLGIEIGRGLG